MKRELDCPWEREEVFVVVSANGPDMPGAGKFTEFTDTLAFRNV